MQALLLPVGSEWHAVELASVREVVRVTSTAPVPRAPAWLVGVANLRGEIVPIVDSAAALGVPSDTPADASHFVLVDTPRGRAGLVVSGPPESITLDEPSGSSELNGARGRFTLGDRVATLLDLDMLGTNF